MPHWLTRFQQIPVKWLRLLLLALAVLCLRDAARIRDARVDAAAMTAEQVRDFFPTAADLIQPDPSSPWLSVQDTEGRRLGWITQTAPESDRIIGYSGSTNCLIAKGVDERVLGIRVLRSGDTADHLAEVVAKRSFFTQFRNQTAAELRSIQPDAVAGASLTSTAIAEGILLRITGSSINQAGGSARFPQPITLEEVQTLLPAAAALHEDGQSTALRVLDADQKTIALALRSSPLADGIIGYKGPSDTLLLLSPDGRHLLKMALRHSYDTKRYVGFVTGDRAYFPSFEGAELEKLANWDVMTAKVQGVSGATETSLALAEGIKKRLQAWLQAQQPPPHWWQTLRWRWQDLGHIIVILSAFIMAFSRARGIPWLRNSHHLLLVAYGGFWSGEMLSQGLMLGWSGAGLPWRQVPGMVALLLVALLAPVFSGKQLYCHHICPHGAFQQLLAKRLPWQWVPGKKWDQRLSRLPFWLLAGLLFSVLFDWGWDPNKMEPFDAYLFRVAGWSTLALAILGLLFSLFTPLAYCRYGCPTGALFKLLRSAGVRDKAGRPELIIALLLTLAWMGMRWIST